MKQKRQELDVQQLLHHPSAPHHVSGNAKSMCCFSVQVL
jgi:hypothetical protein